MIDTLRNSYREEAQDLLQELETALLELEASPTDAERIDLVFRHMHTIKGSGAMFGFERIAAFTHSVENVYDQVRSQRLSVTPELISLTLEARDHIQTLLSAEFGGAPPDAGREERLLEAFGRLSGSSEPVAAPAPKPSAPPSAVPHTSYRIRFRPPRDAFLRGTNPVLLMDALHELGDCTVTGQVRDIPALEEFDPERCYLYWDAVLTTSASLDDVRAVFLFVEDECELSIQELDHDAGSTAALPKLGEILVDRGDTSAEAVRQTLQQQKRLGQLLVEDRHAHPETIRSALAEQQHLKRVETERRKAEEGASIRVAAAKLDSLVNAVGELVTSQARLTRLAAAAGDPDLEFVAEEMERLIDRLRADAMSMRMLPIGATFARFRRLVRDLCRDLGKQIEMTTEGAETELDKNVIEQLSDPLVHIIRNCVDHGIESPEVRAAAGKPPAGSIRLSAVHSGAHVLIRVSDDGAGLDRDRILRKAIERGLVAEGSELSDAEVFRLIFEPGFSTAAEVTEISGRGVGLDVVQRAITALRGSVEVRSRLGEGTSFTLKLPLTLAIIDGLLVSIGPDYFVLPVSNVLECVELTRAEAERAHGRRAVVVRNELIPYVPLREFFGIDGAPPDISQVMLADTEYGKFGFVVDRVIGDHQTVIKSLGGVYRNVEVFSGATVLGDGAVALILDLDKLVKNAVARP